MSAWARAIANLAAGLWIGIHLLGFWGSVRDLVTPPPGATTADLPLWAILTLGAVSPVTFALAWMQRRWLWRPGAGWLARVRGAVWWAVVVTLVANAGFAAVLMLGALRG